MKANFINVIKTSGFINDIGLFIACKNPHDTRSLFLARLEFDEIKEGESPPIIPTMDLDPTLAQKLMDGLWDCGIRPSEGTGSAGALSATQNHLRDMRALVFKNKMEVK